MIEIENKKKITSIFLKILIDGEVENQSQLQFVQRDRPEPIEQARSRITPEEEKMFMDDNTALEQ